MTSDPVHSFRPLWRCLIVASMLMLMTAEHLVAQEPADTNYDEAAVPAYDLPDPFVSLDGRSISDSETWRAVRRPEILQIFAQQVYGVTPQFPLKLESEVLAIRPDALDGQATRKTIRLWPLGKEKGLAIDLLLYLPNSARVAAPVFVSLNYGNQGVEADPTLLSSRNSSAQPGEHAHRWPLRAIIDRGYAVATFHGGDIELDRHGSGCVASNAAVRPLLEDLDPSHQQPRAGHHWGSIGKWAWGLSRVADALEQEPEIDSTRMIVLGHSRTAKTALWAAANDERFAMAISNNSGQGGAALGRRRFGETVAASFSLSGSWYCPNYEQYGGNESALPVDSHLLLASIAPRRVYVASATQDGWADPRGEFLAAWHASKVWELFEVTGLPSDQMPEPQRTVGHFVGYHLREGEHEITPWDWNRYLDFADRHLRRRQVLYNFDGDSCLSTKANSQGPVAVDQADVRRLIDEVAFPGSRVDTVLVCINAQAMYYPSQVGTLRGTRSTEAERAAWPASEKQRFANLNEFFANEIDPYAIMLEESRQRGCEALLTFRMNDDHGNDFLRTRFQEEHPEYRLGDEPYRGLGALDFGVDEVRDHIVDLIAEAVERYECDGIELDFNRFPSFFRPELAQADRVACMNQLVRAVRDRLDEIGSARDRRMILAVRVPSNYGSTPPTPDTVLAIGCDVVHWARHGWVDFVTVSEFLFERGDLPLRLWRQTLPRIGLYGGIECTRAAGERNLNADEYRAAGKAVIRQGMDGVYLFNFFTSREGGADAYEPPFEVLKDLGSYNGDESVRPK